MGIDFRGIRMRLQLRAALALFNLIRPTIVKLGTEWGKHDLETGVPNWRERSEAVKLNATPVD
jgi:hypothetical protein